MRPGAPRWRSAISTASTAAIRRCSRRPRAAVARHGGLAGAMVFEPHPREFFQPDRPHFRLTTLAQKLALFERYGLDLAVVLTFDQQACQPDALATSSSGCWWRAWACGMSSSATTSISARDRDGNAQVMQAGRQGARLRRHGGGDGGGGRRDLLLERDPGRDRAGRREKRRADARTLLAHGGKVVGGAKRGTGLGFPTANIPLPKGTALAHGIYAVFVHVHGERHEGAAYLGTRPTFDDGTPVLETFLFDFNGDLYGREIEIEFMDFIRGDRRFETIERSVAQMDKDCARARAILDDERQALAVAVGNSRRSQFVAATAQIACAHVAAKDASCRRLIGRELPARPPEGARAPALCLISDQLSKTALFHDLHQVGHARLERDPVPAQDRISHARRPAAARAATAGAVGADRPLREPARGGRRAGRSSCCTTARPTPTATSTSARR